MLDGRLENPLALMLLLAAFAVAVSMAAASLWRPTAEEPRASAVAAIAALILLWGVLAPLHVVNRATGETLLWLFGREGADTGVVEFSTVALLGVGAALCVRLAVSADGLARLGWALGAAACAIVLGEEISWGQWLFHWASPEWFAERNLQGETNAHNFLPPSAFELAYAVAGWLTIAAVVLARFTPAGAAIRFAPLRPLRESRFAPALVLTPAVLMQHHFFQELSELALAAAGVYVLAWLAREAPERRTDGLMPAFR